MTDQPPGNYPPPPPPSGGYPPPPPSSGGFEPPQYGSFAQPAGGPGGPLPKESYTPWLTRVLAWVVDYIPVLIIEGIGWGILAGTRETACVTGVAEYGIDDVCVSGATTLGQTALVVSMLVVIAYIIWNYGYRQGTTGSSIGKSILKFKVVSEKTWQPIGFGMSIVRQLAHIIDGAICYIGYLFPLWDAKRQTIADKIMTTVCVPL